MPRTARQVIADLPHHVVQRGNRKQDVFFTEEDYRAYLAILKEVSEAHGIAVDAYCLMRNHVHLVVTPSGDKGLRPISEVNRRYTRYLNKKMGWTGHLWQGRFSSYPMDERYAYEAVRYVELNPVRAGLCPHPTNYRWSSARQRVGKDGGRDLAIATAAYLAVEDWNGYWHEAITKDAATALFEANEQRQAPLGIPQQGQTQPSVDAAAAAFWDSLNQTVPSGTL
jgi:putative transposase